MPQDISIPSNDNHPQIIENKSGECPESDYLQISLLGSPTISHVGQSLSISRRQVRALLYRLAIDFQPISREQLCYIFWADASQTTARRNLTHLLTHLRLALPEPDIIMLTNESVALDARQAWSDTVAFEKLLVERDTLLHPGPGLEADLHSSIEVTESALQHYRGAFLSGFFLPGCSEFEAWVVQQREVYECRYLETLLSLIDIYFELKQYETAIKYAHQYLETDQLAEEVHCKLIEMYAAMGNRSAVERQFEQCSAILEQELSISPSPKTWTVYLSVMNPPGPGVNLPSYWQAERPLSRLKAPFTGREALLERLDHAYDLASLGRGKVFLIGGEPGIGKSRLLQQIVAHYHSHATILYSACSPGMKNLPYHPIAEAFRSVLGIQTPSIKVSLLWLAEAARLLPEIYTRYPDLPTPLPAKPEEARRRLFEALYQLATSLTSRFRPLILCLDDLHWADTTSLEWFIYAGNRLAFEGLSHLMIVGTYRSEESQCLIELRTALNRLGILEEHELDRFETDHVLKILQHLFGSSEENTAVAARLHQISGGNPFFLLETLRALTENQNTPVRLIDLNDLPISRTIQEAIHGRLNTVNRNGRTILDFAAVLNRPFTMQMAPYALQCGELELLDTLETLTSRQLLAEQKGIYDFHHELVRMVIYNNLGYGRRRYLHRQCGAMLEELHLDEISLLAWHFEQCGESGKAARYALQAGEDSTRVFAFREAINFFSRALALLKQEAASLAYIENIHTNYRAQILALSRRGNVYRSLGEMQAYQNDFEEEARLANALGDKIALAHVHLREANAHRWFCRYQQARECAERAIIISQAMDNPQLQARALRIIGLASRAVGDFPIAKSYLEAALKLFQDLAETGYEIHTLCNLSSLYTYMGDYKTAEAFATSALSRCEQAQLPNLRRLALGDLGVTLTHLGRTRQGRECLNTSLEIARQIADRPQEIFCLCNLGWLEIRSGKPDEALGYLRDALALAERLDSRAEQSQLYSGIAETHRMLGNTRLAKSLALKALELARRHGRLHDQAIARQVLSELGDSL